LTLHELDGEAADRGEQQGVNEATLVEQKLFDNPEREEK
jgi:hypothetical protein